MYVGRFAPTPSGDLHLGSLTTAIGSYLRAKAQNGKWLLRIEDLDKSRCSKEATSSILKTLEEFGLEYDGSVLLQSQNLKRYTEILSELTNKGVTYFCSCNRRRLKDIGGIYDGKCRNNDYKSTIDPKEKYAIRFKNPGKRTSFNDVLLGEIQPNLNFAKEDFILKRRDNIFSYNLAVIIDDHDSGVTEVVRGADLIDATIMQMNLFETLNWSIPKYLHLPLVLQESGLKYSKQNHAKKVETLHSNEYCFKALQCLGFIIPKDLKNETPTTQLKWALENFNLNLIPKHNVVTHY